MVSTSGRPGHSSDSPPAPSLDELLRGPIAAGILRALIRDQQRQMKEQGAGVAIWALPVYQALEKAAGIEPDRSTLKAVVRPRLAAVEPTAWVSVMEAAARSGRSERQVRRLASSGSIRAKRVGLRSWLVDIESLENVLRNQAA